MASAYDKASLVMLPNAYKDGKLYSVKPEDRTGDFTFTRGSNLSATRVNSSQLIEKGRENNLLQSNNFGNGSWTKSNSSVASGQSGYDGSSDAWLFTSTGGPMYQSISVSGIVTYSVYAKANSGTGFLLRVDQSAQVKLEFNISTGAFISGSNFLEYKSTSVGNGWYRLSVTFLAATTQTAQIRITNGSGTNTSGSAFIQDAQLEQGLAASSVIETTSAIVKVGVLENQPRLDYSGSASCPSLLLEPSRSNLITQSEYFGDSSWTKSGATVVGGYASPEGLNNSYKLVESSDNEKHRVFASLNGTNGVFSFFAKAAGRNFVNVFAQNGNYTSFNLSNGTIGTTQAGSLATISAFSDGWYRCTLTNSHATFGAYIGVGNTDNGITYTGNGTDGIYIYGASFEQASYATSYIPNHSGGMVTRADDVCNGAGTVNTFNSSQGVLYAEMSALADDVTETGMEISLSGTTGNSVRILYSPNTSLNSLFARIDVGGVRVATFNYTGVTITNVNKFALRWAVNDFSLWINGVKVLTDTNGITFPSNTLSKLNLSNVTGTIDNLEGNVKQLLTFNTALTDTELAKLTTL